MASLTWKERLLRFSKSVPDTEIVNHDHVEVDHVTLEKMEDPRNGINDDEVQQKIDSQKPNEHAQPGVVDVEGITLTWSKKALAWAYFW